MSTDEKIQLLAKVCRFGLREATNNELILLEAICRGEV